MVQRQEPIAFVFDTETTEDWQVEEQLLSLKDYFSFHAFEVGLLVVPVQPKYRKHVFEGPKTISSAAESAHRMGNRDRDDIGAEKNAGATRHPAWV